MCNLIPFCYFENFNIYLFVCMLYVLLQMHYCVWMLTSLYHRPDGRLCSANYNTTSVYWNHGCCADMNPKGERWGGCTHCWWIVGSVYCTLQLHLPVRSAQAHTCLSRSQVWLSDPATLHSHWVHCGECLWGGDNTKLLLSPVKQA